MRAFTYAVEQPWAMTQAALRGILEIAERRNESVEAVAAKLGRPLENTYDVRVRDGVAILPVTGPLFRYANLFTAISGATSIEMLARDFSAALGNPAVKAIVLDVNSPGGEADGVNEFARMIYDARGRKPILAYVGGTGASGAYWVASAADEVVAEESALLGSIGVVATIRDTRERDAKAGVTTYEIVSSQSPYKRPDVATDAGRAQIQQVIDALAEIFVGAVARHRNVSTETVLEKFGRGGILPAKHAVAVGMADRIGTLEGVLASLSAGEHRTVIFSAATAAHSKGGQPMAEEVKPEAAEKPAEPAKPAVDTVAVEAAAKKHERERIQAIMTAPEAEGREELARTLATDTDLTPEAAKKVLAAAPKSSKTNALADAMAQVKNPEVGADVGADANEEDAAVASILAFANPKKEGK